MGEGKPWNRREFKVTSAGFYTVLSPGRWFSTLQLPNGYRYQIKEDGKPKRRLADDQTRETAADATVSLQMIPSTKGKLAWARLGLIVIAAIALFFGLPLFCFVITVLLRQHR